MNNNNQRLTIEDQLQLNTVLLKETIERLNETMIQIAYLQNIVCGQYGINPLTYWPKAYGGTREDEKIKEINEKEFVLSKKDVKELLEVISLDNALSFNSRGGYSVTNNIIDLIVTILRKSDLTMHEAKNILALTEKTLDSLKI